MSGRTLHPTHSGHALVKLRNGSTYVGHATYDGRVVTIDGRLRVTSSTGVSYRPPRRRTVPIYRVLEIVWDADPGSESPSRRSAAGDALRAI